MAMHIAPFLSKPCEIPECSSLAWGKVFSGPGSSHQDFFMSVRKLLQVVPFLFFYPQKERDRLVLRN